MKQVILISIAVFVFVVAVGVILQTTENKQTEYKFPGAAEVVKQYFESWGEKNWVEMYSTISDGFKKIEPTAQTLSDFRNYQKTQGIDHIHILSIKEKSSDGRVSVIDYSIELVANGSKNVSGSFTLKFRSGDIIQGWKITNPYGDKTDEL